MNEIIVNKLSGVFHKNNIISDDNREYFEYGLFLIVSSLTIFVSVMLLSLIFQRFIISLIFSFLFYVTRSVCGGYHCNSSVKCYFTSISLYLIFVSTVTMIPKEYLISFNYPMMIVGAVIILIFSPVVNINNPISESRKNICKIISVLICTLSFILLITLDNTMFYELKYTFSYCIAMTGAMIVIDKLSHLTVTGSNS